MYHTHTSYTITYARASLAFFSIRLSRSPISSRLRLPRPCVPSCFCEIRNGNDGSARGLGKRGNARGYGGACAPAGGTCHVVVRSYTDTRATLRRVHAWTVVRVVGVNDWYVPLEAPRNPRKYRMDAPCAWRASARACPGQP